MKKKYFFKQLFYLFLFIFTISCEDANDEVVSITGDLEIKDFIWQGLNNFYYWQTSVPNLADDRFPNLTESEYINFLNDGSTPTSFFRKLIYSADRFSWIQDNYTDLENLLSGISSSNGLEFQLYRKCSGCPELFGVVRYILANSDAAAKNINRGDIFYAVNGTPLTDSNYRSLLFSENLSYTLNMASLSSGTSSYELVPNNVSVPLVKQVNFQENPIHKKEVINKGSYKIGYLMYNGFLSSFDMALNNAFREFIDAGITDLVLDLRYNPGGSIQTCVYLASMIAGTRSDEVFLKQIWNSKFTSYFESINRNLNTNFATQINSTTPINTLNLRKVYIITTVSSASASELLINGLAPHLDVVHIGDSTTGKNVGSITVYDYIDNEGTKNPNHTYAMQPIVLKVANSDNYADYVNGLAPDHLLKEDLTNLGALGSATEPLFAKAISLITGISNKVSNATPKYPLENKIDISHIFPLKEMMYLDMDFNKVKKIK